MNINILTISKVAVLALGVFSLQGQAAIVSKSFEGNDCAGYFELGNGFSSCAVFYDDNGDIIPLSPVIAKFDADDLSVADDLNTAFPTVDGTEFGFSNLGSENKTGTWTYTPDDDEDPGVRYWASKAGNQDDGGFLLFWNVDDTEVAGGGACDVADVYALACLDAAMVVSTGDWTTPGGKALSHITFYDTTVIPLPAAAWLFLSALGGLVLVKRTKR